MLIKEIIASTLRGLGKINDDYVIRNREVYLNLKNARNTLLKQEAEKGRLWSSVNTQTLYCIKMVRDTFSSKCHTAGELVFRSENPLPTPVDVKGGNTIVAVYAPDGSTIDFTTISDWENSKSRRFIRKKPKYLIRDYIYVVNFDNVLVDEIYINVEGFFEDPEIVEMLNLEQQEPDCDGKKPCKSILDLEFNCPGYITARVIAMAKDQLKERLGIRTDTKNDARDAITAPDIPSGQ